MADGTQTWCNASCMGHGASPFIRHPWEDMENGGQRFSPEEIMYSPKRRFRLFRSFGPVDRIAPSLTTSLSAYTAAGTGSWVKITSTEYTALQTNVSGTTPAGATAATMTAVGTSTNLTTGSVLFTSIVSPATPAVPANSYVYAVSFYYNAINTDVRVYANDSTTSYTNFTQIGGSLPTTTAGTNYYVLKGASTPTSNVDGNLAMWHNDILNQGFKQNVGGVGVRYTTTSTPSSSSSLSTVFATGTAGAFSLQALTTTSKQW